MTCLGKAGRKLDSENLLRMLPRPTPFSVCLFQTSLKVRAELFELPKTDSVANFAHVVKVKVNVVVGVQNYREKFSGRVKVPQVGA